MAKGFKVVAAATVLGAALVAAGCSAGGKAPDKQENPAASGDQGSGGMMGGGQGMGGMNMGGQGSGGMMGGRDTGGKQGEEYTPPTAEQLAKVTRTVTLDLSEFKFDPKDVTLKKGEVVKFVVKNVGALPHDWMAEGIPAVATGEFAAGEERVLVWEADRTGTFTTYCMVPGHREAGMVGTLTVTE